MSYVRVERICRRCEKRTVVTIVRAEEAPKLATIGAMCSKCSTSRVV